MLLWTAFLVGIIGSAHCAGMCGPIALALPLRGDNWAARAFGGILYNTGRVITYVLLGAIFGLLGQSLRMGGFQQWSSIIIGILMIAFVVVPLIFKKMPSMNNVFSGYSHRLLGSFRKLFQKGSHSSLFTIGLLNGILPCGLVYVAIAGALNTGSVVYGMMYMALFGAGTIPVMLGISLAGTMMGLKLRSFINKLSPYVIVLIGVLILLRGLSLGIPYVSPKMEMLTPVKEKAMECCSPK